MNSLELTEALSSFINNKPFNKSEYDWNALYELADKQSVSGILFSVVEKLPESDKPEKSICAKLERAYFQTITDMSNYDYVRQNLSKLFEAEKIDHLFFKGAVVKESYPVPELRTMGDIDLLIKESDRKKTDELMQKLGAECKNNSEPVFVYELKGVLFEIHTRFANDISDKPETNALYEKMWGMSEKLTEHQYALKPDFHLLILLLHLYRHFTGVGCGIRLFLDITAFYNANKASIDSEKLKEWLAKLNLEKFGRLVFFLCNKWFGSDNIYNSSYNEEIFTEVTDYIMQSGTFGLISGSVAQKSVRKTVGDKKGVSAFFSRLGFFINKLFPSYEKMKGKYAFLIKFPFLLPIAWIRNAVYQIKNRKEYVTNYTKELFSSSEETEKIYELFNKLGL